MGADAQFARRRPSYRFGKPAAIVPASRPRGVSLIEVMVSILVFSFGLLGMVGLQARATQVSVDAEDRSRAALLADDVISLMWMRGTSDLSDDTLQGWRDRVEATLPNAESSVEVNEQGLVTVTIEWSAPSRTSAEGNSKYTTQVVLPQ